MFRLASLMLLLCCTSAWAERSLLSGSLGLWLKNSAAPELTDVLGNHPKFKGQRIRFVTLAGGKPADTGNGLSKAIQQQLTHKILRDGKNDVAWQSSSPVCPSALKQTPYMVGIEATRLDRHKHQVRLAVLDTEEGVWVSGISLSWSGRLLSAEARALAEPVANATSGTLLNPIPIEQRKRVLEVMQTQVRCALPAGLEGSVYMQPAAAPQLQLVMRELQQRLAMLPAISTTRASDQAAWHMTAALSPTSFQAQELTISLAPRENLAGTQRIAAVFVTGAAIPATAVAGATPALTRLPTATAPAQRLLGSLRRADDGDACRGRKHEHCVELAFELLDDAHLLVFRTSKAKIHPTTCSTRNSRRERGEHRYRVRIPDLTTRQRAGIYVLASRERAVMRALIQQAQRAPGACDERSQRSHQLWLADMIELVERYGDALEWRALHVRATDAGIETF